MELKIVHIQCHYHTWFLFGLPFNQQLSIPIESEGETMDISCSIKGPGGERLESRLIRKSEKSHHVRFTPYHPGKYTVDVLSNGDSVQNSPFVITVMDEPPVKLNFKTLEKQVSLFSFFAFFLFFFYRFD